MLYNVEYSRLIMIQYALKFYDLIKKQNYLVMTSKEEVINLLWDCENDLMMFDIKAPQLGIIELNKLKSDKNRRIAYCDQLLNILKVGVYNREFGLELMTMAELNKVIII